MFSLAATVFGLCRFGGFASAKHIEEANLFIIYLSSAQMINPSRYVEGILIHFSSSLVRNPSMA